MENVRFTNLIKVNYLISFNQIFLNENKLTDYHL